MSHQLFRLAAQIQNKPLLATEDLAASVMLYINQRISGAVDPMAAVNVKPVTGQAEQYASTVQDGVAFLNVFGALSHRMSGIDAMCTGGLSSYQGLTRAFDEAVADASVDKIVLMIDSGGGEAAGCFELARHIKEHSNGKPVIAYVDERACSAAYALACAASEIYASPNADVGSIGVIVIHQEFSKAMEKAGVQTNIIKAGEVKGMGNPFEPLSDQAKDLIQKSVDNSYTSFVNLVSSSRGISAEAVKDTGARVYGAQEALSLKLIDGIKTTDEFKDYLFGGNGASLNVPNQPAIQQANSEELEMDAEKEKAYQEQIATLQAQINQGADAKLLDAMKPHADSIGFDAQMAVDTIKALGSESDAAKFMTSVIHTASAKIESVQAEASERIATLEAEVEQTHAKALEALESSAAMNESGKGGEAPVQEPEQNAEQADADKKAEARSQALAAAIAQLNKN